MTENQIATIIVDIAFKVHSKLGPGLFESVYEEIICFELKRQNIHFTRQQRIPVVWEEVELDRGFKADVMLRTRLLLKLNP